MTFERMLVISTGHVSQPVAKELDHLAFVHRRPAVDWADEVIVYPHGDHGWLIYISNDLEDKLEKTPACLAYAMKTARDAECNWLLMDQDAEQLDSLAFYEW